MSAKWVRSKQWDERHLKGPLVPLKWVLRTFSEVPTAIVLLVLVVIYGILASIPIGLLASIPTYLFYGVSFLLTVGVIGVLPVWVMTRAMRSRGVGASTRFLTGFIGLALLCAAGVVVWQAAVWPALRFDPVTGKGVRFFGEFVTRHSAVQFRRLPMMEMSELEFYSWWPLTLILVLFVVNLVVATVRRIEFSFPYIGVLMVHSGIVTIALGSVYYARHKQEGDILLVAGQPDAQGNMTPGGAQFGFYDNTQTALWVTMSPEKGWEQRRLGHVPRYNDYNLNVVGGERQRPDWVRDRGALDIPVPRHDDAPESQRVVDGDVQFRVVGYASYADLAQEWAPVQGADASGSAVSMRTIEAWVDDAIAPAGVPRDKPARVWRLVPDSPRDRMSEMEVMAVEYTKGMTEGRWNALRAPIPDGAGHALVVEVPSKGFRAVYPAVPGETIEVGETGYAISVTELLERPPFPIITRGFEGATSSAAIVRVRPPEQAPVAPALKGRPGIAFDRWVYHRFPEITQDMLDETAPSGMSKRRDASDEIRIDYLDCSVVQVYFDEREDGTTRALVRIPGSEPRVTEGMKTGDRLPIAGGLALKLAEKIDRARRVETPVPVAPSAQDKQHIGNHQQSAAAVEVRDRTGKTTTVWLPFTQYLDLNDQNERRVTLGDGRLVRLAFGRVFHEFVPRMSVRLVDFEMTPYPHSTVPRDYSSRVMVSGAAGSRESNPVYKTSLNEPLLVRMDFQGRDDLPQPARAAVNAIGYVASLIAPNQYKFSQAGWDQAGWRQTEQAVAAGELERPFARFTILGVGNNPGIYIIAAGAVMMSVGIPWAFYLKPWLMQRRKRKIQEQVASGTWKKKPESRNGSVEHAGREVQA